MLRARRVSFATIKVVLVPTLFAIGGAEALAIAPDQIVQPSAPSSFAVCSACHATTSAAPPKLGPNLFGIGSRTTGSLPGFAYSPAMKTKGIKWGRDSLLAFVMRPQGVVPGTRMPFGGIQDEAKAEEIVDFLLRLH